MSLTGPPPGTGTSSAATAVAQALGERRRARKVGLDEQHGELLAAEPRRDVDHAHAFPQAVGEGPQHLVPDLVAVPVVDALEVVEVGEDERERLAEALGAAQLGVERLR